MSQNNVEMIRRIFDQAPRDPEVFFASLDDKVEWDAGTIGIPDGGASYWRGPAAVREFFRLWVGPFDEWRIELVEAIDAGDSVVAHVHQWGPGKGSGATVEATHWQVWTIRDGKVVRVTLRVDREEALEAVGLRE
jgi:ketosteroid isomerase-like protein